MKTMWDPEVRAEIGRRAGLLEATAPAVWGKMNAEQMVAHLVASARMATGELVTARKKIQFSFAPLRWLIVHKLPIPRGVPTAPELRANSVAGTLDESRAELERLLVVFAARDQGATFPEHPAFGKLSAKEWGILTYKHFDHHLRQFAA